MKTTVRLAVSLCLAAMALPSLAQFAKPDDAIKYRQSAMVLQGQHFGRIGAMANGRAPFDAASATANAKVLADLAKLPWPAFGPGTEGGKAKPEIWQEQAKFKQLSDQFVAESDKLLVAAQANNLDTLKAQFGATAQTCKACHDAFRNR